MRENSILSVGLLLLALSCSGPTDASTASDASGSWVRVEAHPGSDFEMTLVSNGASLSGTGTFVDEAGPGGTMTIDGEVSRDSVNLDFTLETEFTGGPVTSTGHFAGILRLGQLQGRMLFFGEAADISLDPTVFVRKR